MKWSDYFNRTSLKQYLMVLLGTFIIALAYILFVSPYKFVPGGVYGISIMIHHLTKDSFEMFPDGLPIGVLALLMDIPLTILGTKILGPKFGLKTVLGFVSQTGDKYFVPKWAKVKLDDGTEGYVSNPAPKPAIFLARFKNPDISPEEARKLAVKHPEVKMFEQEDGMFKIPAGQLIDLCGFKRTPDPTVGVAYTNALIVMNLGGAKGKEILEFAKKIKKAVKQRFGIKLEPEVVVV